MGFSRSKFAGLIGLFAALCLPVAAQADWHDVAAEAEAAALFQRNLAADLALGATGFQAVGPVTSPALAPGMLAATAPDWTFAPTVLPKLEIPVQAVFLQDDDGSHPCAITPGNVLAWINAVNQVWAPANIRLTFNETPGSSDYYWLKSTLLNSMTGDLDPQWPAQVSLGNSWASIYPGKLVIFFRYGPGPGATGGGFSWTSFNFIAMPGYYSTGVCGTQNATLLAHELGHYLGLPHTFPKEFVSYGDAVNYDTAGGSGPTNDVFEADGRDATYPDPYIKTSYYQCDPAVTQVVINGKTFVLPRDNVMSYYYPVNEVTSSQYFTSRQTWAVRAGLPLHQTVLGGAVTYEAESLGGSYTGGWWTSQAMSSFLGKWSGNSHLLWLDGAIGDSMTVNFPAGGGGEYDVYASFTAAPDYGIVEVLLNGQAVTLQNLYSSIVLPTGLVFLGTHTLPFGTSTLELKAVGNDPRAASPRQGAGLDAIVLASPSVGNQEVVRQGFPPNPAVLMPGSTGGPVVGKTWIPTVDHSTFQTPYIVDLLAVSGGSANWWLGLEGTVLVDLTNVISWHPKTPAGHWWLSVPLDVALVGAQVHTQVVSQSTSGYFKLTNALDLTIGSY